MTTSPESPLYIQETDVEDLEDYCPGGLHPTIIGNIFHDRYTVVHKLGYGGYSTIWLARDTPLNRYVALKVLVAHKSSRSPEADILQLLQTGDESHPGRRFVPRLLDQFFHEGPNGKHLVLVLEPAGSSLRDSKEDSSDGTFPLSAARSLAAQLLLGLSYVHSRGICHGDLHLGNFLLRIPSFDHLSTEELYERYGRPEEVSVFRTDCRPPEPHAPPHAIYPLRFPLPADEVADPEVVICDFGASFAVATRRDPVLHTPALYLPPEDFFNERVTARADIWTLGATLYELLGEKSLLSVRCRDRDDIVADMVCALGKPPARWWDAWPRRGEFFSEEGEPKTPLRRLEERVFDMGRGETREAYQWEGGELDALLTLLQSMLAYEPVERPGIEDVLRSEYARKWALPVWEASGSAAKEE